MNLDTVTKEEVQAGNLGNHLLLGRMLTGQDAAHKRMQGLIESGEGLPEGVDMADSSSITSALWIRSTMGCRSWSPPPPPTWMSSRTSSSKNRAPGQR